MKKETEKEKNKKRKWKWELHEIINPYLSEKEIGDIINKKLAKIIVELEHNPVSYIKVEKPHDEYC